MKKKKKRKEIHLSVLFLEQVCFYQGSRLISKHQFIRLINRIVKDGQDSTKRSLNRQIVRKEEKGIVHLKILKLDNSIMKIHKSIRTKRHEKGRRFICVEFYRLAGIE